MCLHILPEKGDVGEILMLGNLLDRLIGILQKIFDVFDHIIVYPLEGCLSADLFADGGKIFGSNTQLTRIIGNRTFFTSVQASRSRNLLNRMLLRFTIWLSGGVLNWFKSASSSYSMVRISDLMTSL